MFAAEDPVGQENVLEGVCSVSFDHEVCIAPKDLVGVVAGGIVDVAIGHIDTADEGRFAIDDDDFTVVAVVEAVGEEPDPIEGVDFDAGAA